MNRAFSRSLLLAFALLTLAPVASLAQAPATAKPAQLTRAEMEEFLLKAKILKHKELDRGVTNSRKAVMSDGKITHDVHIQTVDVRMTEFKGTQGTEMNFRDTYKFNVAGYRLDKLMNLNMVPVSVDRRFLGSAASYTWWVDDTLMTELDRVNKKITPQDLPIWNGQMYCVRVFDQLIYNTDRNIGNLVITQDWDIWMIDHTRAFRRMTDLKDVKNLVKCDRNLLAAMRKLNADQLKVEMKGYLDHEEIKALLTRRDLIVKFFEGEVAKKGEAEVLFDMRRH